MARGTRRHTALLRFLEFSPLLAALVLGGLWLSVPKPLVSSSYLVNTWYTSGHEGFEERAEEYFAGVLNVAADSLETEFTDAAQMSYDQSAPHHGDLFDSSGEPVALPWGEDSAWFDPLRAFEQKWGARVYAYSTPAPELPSLAASAFATPTLLPSSAELADATLDVDGRPTAFPASPPEFGPERYRDELEWVWWLNRKYGPAHPYYSPGAPYTPETVTSGNVRFVYESYRPGTNGTYYYAYIRDAKDAAKDSPYPPGDPLNPLDTLDVGSEEFRVALEKVAADIDANVFVAGPLVTRLVPVYPNADSTARVGTQPAVVESTRYTVNTGLKKAPKAVTRLTGAEWMMTVPIATGPQPTADGTSLNAAPAPQGFAYVATWDRRPSLLSAAWTQSTWATRAWLRWQMAVAGNFGWLLGAGLALLGASLIASPAAFIYERRLATEERVLAEMARVQQDAHDKVYNRLSALSKRVALAGAELSRDVAETLERLSEDIRQTVGDLQEILGDANRRTNDLVGVSSIAVQLEQVCRAQAARLDMDVQFEAEGEVPAVSPSTGWDVQCVVEEALTNASRHGRATHAVVRIGSGDGRLRVSVADDGSGIPGTVDVAALPEGTRGLRGMQTRAERLGGTLTIERLDAGTRVVLDLPLSTPE